MASHTATDDGQISQLRKEIVQLQEVGQHVSQAGRAVGSIRGYQKLATACTKLIGGTATGKDRALVQRITEAQKAISGATGDLQQAATIVRREIAQRQAEIQRIIREQQQKARQ